MLGIISVGGNVALSSYFTLLFKRLARSERQIMDIVAALGLSNDILLPEHLTACGRAFSAASLATIKPTNVTRTIVAAPSAVAVVKKFMRLEKYCADPLRLNMTENQRSQLSRGQSFSGQYRFDTGTSCLSAPVRAQMIALFLSLSGHSSMEFSMDRSSHAVSFDIRWKHTPDSTSFSTSRSSDLRDHVQKLITSDPARGWHIEQAARDLGLTSRSLQRYLKAAGCSFSEILRGSRLSKAQTLLKNPDFNLAEIGYCCGYADQAHFQREFRNVVQLTPRKYRLGFLKHVS